MYDITDCCRICLNKENTLVDIITTQTNTESLINKLQSCVSEVEWSSNSSILMCPTCINKLNSAYEFKNQCLQSTKVFENCANLNLKQPQIKPKDIELNQDLLNTQLPNIVLTSNNCSNNFQNLFFNLLPSTTINVSQPNISFVDQEAPAKDVKQKLFVNINNSGFHNIVPIVSTSNEVNVVKQADEVNISKILNETNSEELSIEIDPTCFECLPEEEARTEDDELVEFKDWEDILSCHKSTSEELHQLKCTIEAVAASNSDETSDGFVQPVNKFVPIRSKANNKKKQDEKMMEFFNIDHFMADQHQTRTVVCEECGQMCDNIKSLYAHIRQAHSGNFPYRCKQCSSVYALHAQFEAHMRKHDVQKPHVFTKEMITLDDLSQHNESILFPSLGLTDSSNTNSNVDEGEDEGVPDLSLEFKCQICPRSFVNVQALNRHKFKRHQQSRRKYFVKGMKNAKCDICNREFSTQSYLQLHIKLHFRKMGYRFKVFDKNKYVTKRQNENKNIDDKENEKCDEVIENKNLEEKMDEEKSENGETVNQHELNNHGLKIKISLKNLKNSDEEVNDVKNNGEITSMEVDPSSEEVDESNTAQVTSEIVKSEPETQSCVDDMDNEETYIEDEAAVEEEELPQKQSPINAELIQGKQQCSFCFKLYRRKHDLKRHLNNIHLKAIQYVCHLCNIPFYEAFQLTRHLRQHNGFVRCGSCLKEYSILRDLKLHIIAAHDNSALCQCGTCGQSFPKVRHLREHMHDHDKSIIYKCHLCSEEFKESRDLSRHLVEHSGMYACNICHTTFAAEQELNNHSKCHSDDPGNERKYKCDICPSKFKKKRYLMAHVKKTHADRSRDDPVPDIIPIGIELNCKSA